MHDTLAAFRQGAGPEMGIHLDVNYHFKTEGNLKVAKAVEPFDLTWLEIDNWDPQSLALIRSKAPCPIASLESVCGRRAFRPVPRRLFHRCRNHRRDLERLPGVHQDRRDGRGL